MRRLEPVRRRLQTVRGRPIGLRRRHAREFQDAARRRGRGGVERRADVARRVDGLGFVGRRLPPAPRMTLLLGLRERVVVASLPEQPREGRRQRSGLHLRGAPRLGRREDAQVPRPQPPRAARGALRRRLADVQRVRLRRLPQHRRGPERDPRRRDQAHRAEAHGGRLVALPDQRREPLARPEGHGLGRDPRGRAPPRRDVRRGRRLRAIRARGQVPGRPPGHRGRAPRGRDHARHGVR
mmetsp:Transcript_15592/g.48325  ORF Transcript_15592/g.48325 Transcript_15592/m.48325 type:complete len:239 (+) Transcript_15592:553-1269(+)